MSEENDDIEEMVKNIEIRKSFVKKSVERNLFEEQEAEKISYRLTDILAFRQLQQVFIGYSELIVDEILENPELIQILLEEMDLSQSQLFAYLAGNTNANIVLYYTACRIVEEQKQNKEDD